MVRWLLHRLLRGLRRGRCVTIASDLASCLASHPRGHSVALHLPQLGNCPANVGKWTRHLAGFLVGWFADAARPARGTPLKFRRAIGESEEPYEAKGEPPQPRFPQSP